MKYQVITTSEESFTEIFDYLFPILDKAITKILVSTETELKECKTPAMAKKAITDNWLNGVECETLFWV